MEREISINGRKIKTKILDIFRENIQFMKYDPKLPVSFIFRYLISRVAYKLAITHIKTFSKHLHSFFTRKTKISCLRSLKYIHYLMVFNDSDKWIASRKRFRKIITTNHTYEQSQTLTCFKSKQCQCLTSLMNVICSDNFLEAHSISSECILLSPSCFTLRELRSLIDCLFFEFRWRKIDGRKRGYLQEL